MSNYAYKQGDAKKTPVELADLPKTTQVVLVIDGKEVPFVAGNALNTKVALACTERMLKMMAEAKK